jgi:hypothetical protein
MPTVIPLVPSDASYRLATNIENENYIFFVRWNSRDAAWYFDLLEQNGTMIARGVKIVLGAPLARSTVHRLFAAGVFVARDTTKSGKEPTLDDLGTRVQLWYLTTAEMVAEILGVR